MERKYTIFRKGTPYITIQTQIHPFSNRALRIGKSTGYLPKNSITVTHIKRYN
jgi:hypothetical protein